ncbi:MAG: M28 family peptidase [Gemmatimonadaceae bacterium]
MPSVRTAARLSLSALLLLPALASAQTAARVDISPAKGDLPIKYTGKPTTAPISAADLMTRLYIFADDSMMGRQVGTEYNLKGTAYIEREVRRIGLVPAGENGGYFQNIPLFNNYVDSAATAMKAADQTLKLGVDFLPIPRAARTIALGGVPVMYAGSSADSSTWPSAAEAMGKILVLSVPSTPGPFRPLFNAKSRFAGAAAILVVGLQRFPPQVIPRIARSTALRTDATTATAPSSILVTPRVLSLLFGATESLKAGAIGKGLTGTIVLREDQAPGRNVVAILPGSDPGLRGQYVAVGAHNDHIGFNKEPVDHDSLKAYMAVARPQGADSPSGVALLADQTARIRAVTDSLHKLHGVRKDSIYNGADDDGSGSMSVLEIAEELASASTKPKRSILFVWHTGEEAGLYGSQHYTDHPTVPRDSIVAQLNMDMVGRGAKSDATGEKKEGGATYGGPGYVQLVGSRRLSTELGDLIEEVNRTQKLGLNFDYGMDANGHPQNIYCRSDHYEYARYGIPIVFFTTGGHADYHQVTDEPQYIDYNRMAQVATLVRDATVKVANLDHRVVVDKIKPDPKATCSQ